MLTRRDKQRLLLGTGVIGLLALAVAACWPIWSEIASIGLNDPENSHILLAIPVAGFLAWLRRGRIRKMPWGPSPMGPILCLLGLGLVATGPVLAFDAFSHLGALLLALGAVSSMLGFEVLSRFKPAVLSLFFLLPVPGGIRQGIALPLQEISARFVEFSMDLFGITVLRTGNALSINGVDVAVAEACNGMRMVSALALVTVAFVFSVPMRNSVRLVFIALSPAVALVVNIVRLVPTVLFYGYSDPETADFFHDVSGWGALAVALAILSGVLWLLRWIEVPVAPYPVFAGKEAR